MVVSRRVVQLRIDVSAYLGSGVLSAVRKYSEYMRSKPIPLMRTYGKACITCIYALHSESLGIFATVIRTIQPLVFYHTLNDLGRVYQDVLCIGAPDLFTASTRTTACMHASVHI